MSFILDALRKSEQERQIAAGRGAGLLYPLIDRTQSEVESDAAAAASRALPWQRRSVRLWPRH